MVSEAKQLISEYQPAFDCEKGFKKEMLEFLDKHPDAFERSCLEGHFTASSWLLSQDGTKALLLHHRKLDRWFQLGGHCDGDSDLLGVSIKEAQEESGITGIEAVSPEIFDLDIHGIPPFKNDPAHLHLDVRFLLKVVSDEEVVQNEESRELRWFTKDDQIPGDNESVLRLRDKWRSGFKLS